MKYKILPNSQLDLVKIENIEVRSENKDNCEASTDESKNEPINSNPINADQPSTSSAPLLRQRQLAAKARSLSASQ